MSKQNTTEKELDFEASLVELETIVRKLETGNVPLEESIKLYQRGLELYGICFERLNNAEELIVKMNEKDRSE